VPGALGPTRIGKVVRPTRNNRIWRGNGVEAAAADRGIHSPRIDGVALAASDGRESLYSSSLNLNGVGKATTNGCVGGVGLECAFKPSMNSTGFKPARD
jgi:hypothetical protein